MWSYRNGMATGFVTVWGDCASCEIGPIGWGGCVLIFQRTVPISGTIYPGYIYPGESHMRQAFTLIEVIIVIVVIGILAAAVIPKAINAQQETALAATVADLKAIENAVSLYYSEYGAYPRDVNRREVVDVLDPYFKSENPFSKTAPIGGIYDYEGPPNWSPVQISIRSENSSNHSEDKAIELDAYMDNGDLSSGTVRRSGNRTYYIIGK
ncbi:MAG TPA: hypothetical protein DF699_00185 [Phycisphaerales bacterium]|nr:hypothetical protein [Phycisphaerales bacterium]